MFKLVARCPICLTEYHYEDLSDKFKEEFVARNTFPIKGEFYKTSELIFSGVTCPKCKRCFVPIPIAIQFNKKKFEEILDKHFMKFAEHLKFSGKKE